MSKFRRILVTLTPGLTCVAIGPGWFWHFDITPKVIVLLVGTALAILSMAWRVADHVLIGTRAMGRHLLALLALQLIAFAIATSLSAHRTLSVFGGDWRRLGFISFCAIIIFAWVTANSIAQDRTVIPSIMRAVVWSGGAVALYGILQYFGFDPFISQASYLAGQGAHTIVRPPGTLGQADYFGCYLLFVFWYAIALLSSEARGVRALSLAVSALAFLAIVLSGTRAALLGLVLSVAAVAPFYVKIFRRRHVIVLLTAIALFGLFVFSPFGLKLRARARWSAEDGLGGARLMLWKDATNMVLSRPLRGFGPETFTTEFPKFQSLQLARAYPEFYYESAHNVFLDVATSQGAISALILLVFIAYGLRAAWRIRIEYRQLALCLGATLVATTLCQQFTVFVLPTCLLFYLTISIVVGASIRDAPERSCSVPLSRLSVAASLAIALTFVITAIRLGVSDMALSVALSTLRERKIGASLQDYERWRAWQVGGTNADLLYSRAMAVASVDPILSLEDRSVCWRAAISAGIRAPETCENTQNAYYNLALLMIGQGELERAEWSLRSAILASPNWFKPHWTLAKLLRRADRYDEATTEALAAVERNGGRNPGSGANLGGNRR